jgi:hypothetical protein
MEQTAWVHKLGSEKYGSHNWRKTGVCASTYVNAILRHLNAWRDGEDLDPESGISHIAHVACCCNILLDAEYCGKLQDDRSKVNSYDKLHELLSELKRDQENEVEESDGECRRWPIDEEEKEENPYAKRIKDFLHSLNGDEHRVLDRGEILKDGDEVYVGFGDWMTLYIPHWIQQTVNDGTYRRKVANCDLEETCDSKPEPQLKVADCDLKESPKEYRYGKRSSNECRCGRDYTYHWLYGWCCEDCELYSDKKDYYP